MRPLPDGILGTVRALPRLGSAVLLLRHADREPVAPGDDGTDIGITEEGAARAEALGRLLRDQGALWVETSPLRRCRRTAEQLLAGAGQAAPITDNTWLGAPGPFVVDRPAGAVLFASVGTEHVVRRQIAGEEWPPMRPTREGVRLLLEDVTRRLRERGGTALCVSHDAILMPVIASLTGERFDGCWLEPLDGMALGLGADGQLFGIFREQIIEVTL